MKATRRQRVKVERQSKATRETTAIIKSNGSDLMSEKGNLDFGIRIWYFEAFRAPKLSLKNSEPPCILIISHM